MKVPPHVVQLRLLLCLLAVVLAGGGRPACGADTLWITEFMASNSKSLADEDGEFADWIEVHNPGDTPVDLLNWCLTDNPRVLARWRFPAGTLGPGRFLIVFASEKDRRVPGAPLHTNFKLSADGEYLALVRPDGVTITSEFAPLFPRQSADVSYGLAATGTNTTLIAPGAPARAFVPVDGSLGLTWTLPGFDDSGWLSGSTAVGYERGSGYGPLLGLDLLAPAAPAAQRIDVNGDGVNENNSVYVRVPFVLEDPKAFNTLALRMRYDDGFVAYLNGREVVRANDPPILAWNAAAASDHGDTTDVMLAIAYGPGNAITIYRDGAIYAGPASATLGDLQTYPANVADVLIGKRHDDLAGTGTRTGADGYLAGSVNEARIYARALGSAEIAALFQRGVAGDNNPLPPEARVDLLHQWTFNDGTARDSIGSAHGTLQGGAVIQDGRLILDGIDDFMRSAPIGTTVSARTLVVWVSLDNLVQQAGSALTLENPSGSDVFDGIVFAERVPGQWMNGSSFFARSVANNGGAAETVRDTVVSAAETFDLSEYSDRLIAGTNILAIHGLNLESADPDFLLLPELIAGGYVLRPGEPGFFGVATPGAMNGGVFQRLVAGVFPDHARGFYREPFSLSITSDVPGVTLRYSVDGSAPGATAGSLYSGPIPISRTTTIRVAAFQPGFTPTEPVTHTFIFPADILRQTNSAPAGAYWDTEMDPNVVNNTNLSWSVGQGLADLPVVSIVMDNADLFGPNGLYQNATARGDEWERATSVELFYPPEYTGRRSGEGFAANCGIQINGNFSRLSHQPKHSFRLVFKDKWGRPTLKFPLFPDYAVDEFDTLLVSCGHNQGWSTGIENSQFLRNRFTWQMEGVDDSAPAVHSLSVHVYLNGMYWGLYDFHERPDESFAAANFGGAKEEYDVFKGLSTGGSTSAQIINGIRDAWEEMFALADRDLSNPTNYAALSRLLDIDQLIDYSIGILYTADRDGPTGWLNGPPNSLEPKNFYASRRRDPDGRFRFWRWDSEFTFESVEEDVSERQGTQNPGRLHYNLRANPEYRLRFADRVQRYFFNDGPFTVSALTSRYLALAAGIDKAVVAESARWGDAKREPPFSREVEWVRERDRITTNYIPARLNVFLAQLRVDRLFPATPAPVLSINGGPLHGGLIVPDDVLTLSAPVGRIYFTLDGTDPRDAEVAGLSSHAQPYTSPLVLRDSVVVRARVLDGNQWSPLAEATFFTTLDFSDLRVTEVMYHPPDSGPAAGRDSEFVELKNTGAATLALEGLRLSGGISFTFPRGALLPPGGFIVLAADPALFRTNHPGAAVDGVYRGQLGNAGDTLRLTHPVSGVAWEFAYGDAAPWPASPDGHGYSLVPRDPSARMDAGDPSSWRASTARGGSPGADDPPGAVPAVVINEILTASAPPLVDAIEIFNPTGAPARVGGWFLTDDPARPRKFRLPDGLTLAPGEFAVFDETQFNPAAATTNNFSLSSRGEEVYLFSADEAGGLTGYDHGVKFGAAADGVTFGRLLLSTGEENFPAQIRPSFPGTNAGPRLGPVVISEIHYHPLPGDDGFVEIENISGSPVALDDAPRSTNTWKVNGLGFSFPPGTVLAKDERVLLTAGDPVAFRARYQLPGAIRVFGPFGGNLQNNGERLELQRPGPPDTNGVPFITVDEVRYRDRAPWPQAADGAGASLQRLAPGLYGNEPLHWLAAVPTPGDGPSAGTPPVINLPPASITTVAYLDTQLTVSAVGQPPLRYQWWFKDSILRDATNTTLLLTNVQASDAGPYRVTVLNAFGSAASPEALLTVRLPAIITRQPIDRVVTNGGIASLSVTARGRGVLRYQWRFQEIDLPGATNATLTLSNVTTAAAGSYRVIVTDEIGSTPSVPASLTVLVRPGILVQPQAQTVVQGETVVLRVVTAGSVPMGYRWRRNGATLISVALNANTSSYTISNVQPSHAGTYTVVVTNGALFSGVLSVGAALVVLPDGDHDGLPDAWETANRLDPASPADGLLDSDGDTMTNLQEYLAGTDPRDAASLLQIRQLAPSGGGPGVAFDAVSNRSYTVEWREAADRGRWTRLADVPALSSNRVERVPDPYPAADGRIYRVLTPRQPDGPGGPILLRSPRSQLLDAGETISLSVFALGSGDLGYQWLFNGSPIPGATAATHLVPQAQPAAAGSYTVLVTDQLGVASNQPPAILAVRPLILTQPQGQTVGEGARVTFSVSATGSEPLGYRWKRNGLILSGATNAVLTLDGVRVSDAGMFQAIVTHETPLGPAGTVSSNAVLVVH